MGLAWDCRILSGPTPPGGTCHPSPQMLWTSASQGKAAPPFRSSYLGPSLRWRTGLFLPVEPGGRATPPPLLLEASCASQVALASPDPKAHLASDCRRALPPGIPGHRTSPDRYRHAGLGGLGRDAATQPCRPCPPPPGSPQPTSQPTAHTAASSSRSRN